MDLLRSCVWVLLVTWWANCGAVADTLPNVVVILADDMGWGDPQCYNPKSKISTPNIDRLASQGMRFTDAHTPSSVCTPTRYGLLVGRYCWRTRLKSSVLDGLSPPLIESSRTTMATYLRDRGYATACVGKWHLGMEWTRTDGQSELADRGDSGFRSGEEIDFSVPLKAGPLTAGFDHFFGISASLDMPPYCWIRDDRCVTVPNVDVPRAKDTIFLNQTGGRADEDFALDDVLPRLKDHAVDWILQQHAKTPE
ncbi:MAG: sulfatase-like hydrolase/transferase, partial [Rubripirellula sp.]